MLKKIWFFILFIGFFSSFANAGMYASMQEENRINNYLNSIQENQNNEASLQNQEKATVPTTDSTDNFGINLSAENMSDGTATFSIYDATKVKKDRAPGERTSVMSYIQDIVLATTTFIGTVVTLALVLSGLLYVFSSVDSSLKSKAKSGMKYSLIGMVVVMLSLVIIRLIQFLARGGS